MNLTHIEKVILYCFGSLNDWPDSDFFEKGRLVLGEVGFNEYEKLKSEGFEPSDQELRLAFSAIQEEFLHGD